MESTYSKGIITGIKEFRVGEGRVPGPQRLAVSDQRGSVVVDPPHVDAALRHRHLVSAGDVPAAWSASLEGIGVTAGARAFDAIVRY